MSNAGYGNHTEDRPGQPADSPGAATAEPAAKSTDRPGSAPGEAVAPTPVPAADGQHLSTPGAGALPSGPAGDEADPAAG